MVIVNLTDEELRRLKKVLDKNTDTKLFRKICHKYKAISRGKVRKLRRLSYLVKRAREEQEFTKIPKWLFEELPQPRNPEPESLETLPELLTIDTIKMLHGQDRKQVLDTYYDWKRRQKETDKKYLRSQENKIKIQQQIHADPEGYFAKKKQYAKKYSENAKKKLAERRRKDKKWRDKQNAKGRAYYAKNKEKLAARNRERYRKLKTDPKWVAKQQEQDKKRRMKEPTLKEFIRAKYLAELRKAREVNNG